MVDRHVMLPVPGSAYEKGFKSKGSIIPAGYRVEEDVDACILQRLKAVAKKLGADENDVPAPVKYPEHTFELYHDRRRPYYITADNDEEKKEWIKVIKDCCYRCNGLKNPDPIARVAFKDGFYQARRECGYYYANYYSGTEEQILSDTIVGAIDARVMSEVYSSLYSMPGGYAVRRKVREQIIKSLDSLVMAMVIPSYKGQVETTSKMKTPLEDIIMEKKDDIIDAQNKITSQLSEKLDGTLGEVIGDDVNKGIDTLVFKIKDVVAKCIPLLRENVVKVFEYVTNKAKDNDDIEASLPDYFKSLDQAKHHGRHRSKVLATYEPVREILKNHPLVENGGNAFYNGRDMVEQIIDGAAYTFEELFKELIKGTDALKNGKTAAEVMTTCKDQIMPKFDADAKLLPDEVSFEITRQVLIEMLTKKLEPLTKDMRKELKAAVPKAVNKVVSVDERYETYIKKVCGDLIKNATKTVDSKGQTKEEENPDENPSTEL
ncbi:PH domain-containing protein [Exaiptasia diaphana]|nr:PH domain-containing protein [Exaiptasia diaphana]